MPRRAIRPVFDRLTSRRLPTRGTAWHVVGLPRTGPLPSGCGRDSGRLHGSAPPSGGDPSGRNPHGGFRPAKRNGRPGPPHLRGGGSGGAAAVLEARLPPEPPAAGQVTSRRKEIPHPSVDSSRRISPACRRAVDRTLETGARRLSVAGPERHAGSVHKRERHSDAAAVTSIVRRPCPPLCAGAAAGLRARPGRRGQPSRPTPPTLAGRREAPAEAEPDLARRSLRQRTTTGRHERTGAMLSRRLA